MCDFLPNFANAITASYLVDDICGNELRKWCDDIIIKDMRNGDTYKNGALHSFDGEPARIRKTYKEWFKNDKLHNEDSPAKIEIINDRLIEYYYSNGLLHRDDGPAYIEYCIKEEYYNEYFIDSIIKKDISTINKRHFNLYSERWFQYEKEHREDGPAVNHWRADGTLYMSIWYQHGKKHRDDEPADIQYYPDGILHLERWYQNGKCHRINELPAVIIYDYEGNIVVNKQYENDVCVNVYM
jgi:hypothetical protein